MWCPNSMSLFVILAALVAQTIGQTYEDRQYYQYRGPPAPLNSDGLVMDTPEVAHARAAHLAMHAETMARLRKAQEEYEAFENTDDESFVPQLMDPLETVAQKRLRQRLLEDPRPVENPQMTEAKTVETRARSASKEPEFYDEFDIFDGRQNWIYIAPVRFSYKHAAPPAPVGYRGPLAPLGPDGRVIDTPEVTRAREAHMKAHARAVALSTQNDLYY